MCFQAIAHEQISELPHLENSISENPYSTLLSELAQIVNSLTTEQRLSTAANLIP
jgi:hypothetical protein